MAASGIAEHDEARRRERVYLRKAFMQKEAQEAEKERERQRKLDIAMGRIQSSRHSSYDCEVQRRLNMQSSRDVDRQRREAHCQQSAQDYSAKLPNRYTSIDYQSQW